MFCKWCGADVEKKLTKCLRCGRELPALSDCAGFFDLVPEAKNKIPCGCTNGTNDECGKKRSESALDFVSDKNVNKSGKLLFAVSCAGFTIIVALLLMLMVKVGRLSGNVALEEQNVFVCVDFEETKDDISIKTSAEANKVSIPVANKATFDKNKDVFVNMIFDVSENEESLKFSIIKADDESKQGYQTVEMRFEVDESVFCKSEGDLEYSWSYRFSRDSDWLALDETIFSPSQDGKTLSYEVAAAEKLCENGEAVELQLTISRSNEKGGSLKVVISGVLIAEKTAQ